MGHPPIAPWMVRPTMAGGTLNLKAALALAPQKPIIFGPMDSSMEKMIKLRYSEKELPEIARLVLENAPSKNVALHGPMGAGKTTLVREIMAQLGGLPETNSPTFGIVNEYVDPQGSLLARHFDFYRLNTVEEAYDMGLEEYFMTDCWSFMEWPQKVSPALPHDTVHLTIAMVDAQTRELAMPRGPEAQRKAQTKP
ncbi:tRNA (adenosine(37)-N6)-threonylcarbamoyltransferase complex ATPase subunit type 1 TsaE [Maribacter sp. 2307ULW6-5]|uniref:tRNA (adenosine(37)-N6)-threonylcarbamoyltransferase complex ATPase subunit type 1 TsaE n=1 Tax=Maribacter sp. 2307ULW6-5 TaxID=3386275 RepID=UPI0039BC3132